MKRKEFVIKDWIICDKSIQFDNEFIKYSFPSFNLYSGKQDVNLFNKDNLDYYIILNGYVLPRNEFINELSKLSQIDLIFYCFLKYGDKFIEKIKGNFNIIIIFDNKFRIYNDRIGIIKFFYYNIDQQFIISNQIKYLKTKITVAPNYNSMAIAALFHRYLAGNTAYKDIKFSEPSQFVYFDLLLKIEQYWSVDELLNLNRKTSNYKDFAEYFSTLLENYVSFLKPASVSLTLTGGLDSRTILAALLNKSIKPRAYTYGDPKSRDAVFANMLSNKLGLFYSNHYPDSIDSKWFSEYANKIIQKGNTLCSIHRAHRLDSISHSIQSENEMLIGGYMGNETTRGLSYDDLIISEFLHIWWTSEIDKKKLIKQTLSKYFINYELFEIDDIYNQITSMRFIKNDLKLNHFYATFDIKASNHHFQDPYLFSSIINFPVPIFMDIDFLYFIFSSSMNLLDKVDKDGFRAKVKNHELNLKVISHLAPELNRIPFGKNGYYSINEYFSNKLLLYIKRFIRLHFSNKYPTNFQLGTWMKEFILNEKDEIISNPVLSEFINITDMYQNLENEQSTIEKDWIRYTNVVSLNKVFGK